MQKVLQLQHGHSSSLILLILVKIFVSVFAGAINHGCDGLEMFPCSLLSKQRKEILVYTEAVRTEHH